MAPARKVPFNLRVSTRCQTSEIVAAIRISSDLQWGFLILNFLGWVCVEQETNKLLFPWLLDVWICLVRSLKQRSTIDIGQVSTTHLFRYLVKWEGQHHNVGGAPLRNSKDPNFHISAGSIGFHDVLGNQTLLGQTRCHALVPGLLASRVFGRAAMFIIFPPFHIAMAPDKEMV